MVIRAAWATRVQRAQVAATRRRVNASSSEVRHIIVHSDILLNVSVDVPNTAHMHDRVSKSHHNVDGNKSSSPANSSPANHSHNNALAASPLSSPTSSTGPYHFSMSSDGRPIFTSTSNTSEPSTNSLLARLGKRVETPVDDNDYDENVY